MKTVIDKMIHSWEWRDNFLADLDLSKEEAAFYRAVKQDPVCYLPDCRFAGTEDCRVDGLGVRGINKCPKYYARNDQGTMEKITGENCLVMPPLGDLLTARMDELKLLETEAMESIGKSAADGFLLDAQHHAAMAKVHQSIKRELEFWHSLASD